MLYHLISHPLCPYVQRVAITLAEKNLSFERTDIDLSNKPDWFLKLSPSGKTPVLKVADEVIFESAVICEYLEQEHEPALLAAPALARARQRGWIEFASSCLQKIASLYQASAESYPEKQQDLLRSFQTLESALSTGPYFAGAEFSLVDAAFAPVFGYLPVFAAITGKDYCKDLTRLQRWQQALSLRPSVQQARRLDYADLLLEFLRQRSSHLGQLARQHRP